MIIIKGGRIIDPKNKMDQVADVLIIHGKINMIAKDIQVEGATVIDGRGKIVTPGFIDIHVHLREPGFEHKETIKTGTRAAAMGGFTTVACMPNTKPAIHSKEVIAYIRDKADKEGIINVLPIGAITMNIEGNELCPIDELVKEGVVAISDDGRTSMDLAVMEAAFIKAKEHGIPLIDHCEDMYLAKGGSINEGDASIRTGIKGIPTEAEWKIVERDIELGKKTKAHVHIAHVSTKKSVDLIREAKREGVKITCEVAPHHFTLNDEIIRKDDAYTKVNPPIRGQEDVNAMIQGLIDGTIDIIATDHAPHDKESKEKEYNKAAFGISGIETSFPISYTELVLKEKVNLNKLIELMSTTPAQIIGIDKGSLGIGKDADIAILDLNEEEVIDSNKFISKGKNTPFNGKTVKGKVVCTLVGGKIIMDGGKIICS